MSLYLPRFKPLLEPSLICLTLALAVVHAWAGRDAMNVDGMSYMDAGNAFFRHDWALAINGWWSPLYPWTLGMVLGIAKPSPQWEFPLVHVVNLVVFVGCLFAFRSFVHALLSFVRERTKSALPDWIFILLSYSIFAWIGLEIGTVFDISPDLAVIGCCCWTAGALIRARSTGSMRSFALLGFALGFGYWVKTILFPLGFVVLFVAYLWNRSDRRWVRGIALSGLLFVATASPFIILLSWQKGRFTFGDSGRVNYAWAVSPRSFTRNWQGAEPGSGVPAHATRQLLAHPAVFEFDGPVNATYPPWADPSYWNEGLQWHFALRPQIEVLVPNLRGELRLLLRDKPEIVVGIAIIALLGGQLWLGALRELWPLVAVSLVGMGLYLPLVENDRYLGGFLLVLFVTMLSAARLRPDAQKAGVCVGIAVFGMMTLAIADFTVRVATHHMAIPNTGPYSTASDLRVAKRLEQIGVGPGTKVAIIGDGTGAYWAYLAKARIVAEIMGMNHGVQDFWNSPPEVQQRVYDLFRSAHAKLVVTKCPTCPQGGSPGWEPIPSTTFCLRRLD